MANNIKFIHGQKCPGCEKEVIYNHMPSGYARVHQGRKVCKYCKKWFHRNCLLGQTACLDCFDRCTDREIRQILINDAHVIVNGRHIQKTHQDESKDIVALQLWMLYKLQDRFNEKEIARVMRFDHEWVTKTVQTMRDKEVILPDGKISLDVDDEQPLTFYVAIILNSLLVQGMIDRKEDEKSSPS